MGADCLTSNRRDATFCGAQKSTTGELAIIMSDAVLTDLRDGIAVLTLNRPHKLNAWDTGMRAVFEERTARRAANGK